MKNDLKFLTIQGLCDLHENDQLLVNRKYQRASNWDASMQKLFIDSILRGYPIPLIYIHKQNDKYFIVDGQQRINAIIAFIKNKYRLLNPKNNRKLFPDYLIEKECSWSDKKYNELSNTQQSFIKELLLSVALIESDEDREIRNLFVRLQKGKPLTAQQIRDTSISGINDFVLKIGGKNDIQRNIDFELKLIGTDGTPNGHDFFNECIAVSKTDRGQTRQLASQLLMLYLEMIDNNRTITINSANIDDFYLKNLDFDKDSDKAKDFKILLDILYDKLDASIKLDNYEAIHLLLFLKKLKDLGLKNYKDNLLAAFNKFRENLKIARSSENGEYWNEFGIRTGTNATNANTIAKRHKFFVDKMIDFMFNGYENISGELDNNYNKSLIVANENYKNLAEAIHILIPNKSPYLQNIAIDYLNIGNSKESIVNEKSDVQIQNRSNQTARNRNKDSGVNMQALIDFVNACIQEDDKFIKLFEQATIKTKKRKLVDKDKNKLFTNRHDLVEQYSKQLINNWWIGTNNSNNQNTNFYEIAKQIIDELKNKTK